MTLVKLIKSKWFWTGVVAFWSTVFLITISRFSLFEPNVHLKKHQQFFYIKTNTNYEQLIASLNQQDIIINQTSFKIISGLMNLKNHVHPGKYLLTDGMSNLQIIRLLRSGMQQPVKLVLLKYRTTADLVHFISSNLEVDSIQLTALITDSNYLASIGFDKQTIMALFVPNTYEFWWDTDAKSFLKRMKKEYNIFWNAKRLNEANEQGLSPISVSILASIIEEETNANDEKSMIASVYLNRLRSNIPLEADPTIKYALGDFTLKRILKKYLHFDSHYNTYMYPGLPPGPICNPSIASIDAVLNPAETNYMFFCASVENPGHHVFAKNYSEHLKNARHYQHYLNEQGL